MTIWKPDTCDCIIDYENKKMIKNCCKEHKTVNDVIKHNQLFNYRYGESKKLSIEQVEFLKLAKRQEKNELRKGNKKQSKTFADVDNRNKEMVLKLKRND